MKLSIITILALTALHNTSSQNLSISTVKFAEKKLEDVMEFVDTTLLKSKFKEVKFNYINKPNTLTKLRMALLYHEMAFNFSFLKNAKDDNYAQKSYQLLSELIDNKELKAIYLPFAISYQASALALVSSKTRKLKLLHKAFQLFNKSVEEYGNYSYAPEYMRGSVAENLPWFLFKKKKNAKKDFESITHTIRIATGDKDKMVSPEETLSVFRMLPNASCCIFPNTDHPIEKYDVKRLSREIFDFFN